jgi:phosphatidylinositol alpha-1,6-mannosyltransferase
LGNDSNEMHIIYLTPGCFDKGGISRYNRYQVKVFRDLYGNESTRVFSLLGPDDNSFEDNFNVYWHGKASVSIFSKIGLILSSLRLAVFWKPDIIWIAHINLSLIGWFIAKLSGARSVLNVYGLEVWSKKRWDAKIGLSKVDLIISDCHNTADYIIANDIRSKNSVSVIWDCVDIERFRPGKISEPGKLSKYGIGDGKEHFYILTLGRLSKPDAYYKGYTQLLDAFSRLEFKYPSLRMIFAGRGNFIEDLKCMTQERGLNGKVIFTGSIEEEDLVDVYRSCFLFSLITESGEGKGEGIPLTPLEAMACGKPILVGNQDGSREAIFNECNGFLLDPNDISGITKAIETYLNSEELLTRHSSAARQIVESYFSYLRFKNEHINLLKQILKN